MKAEERIAKENYQEVDSKENEFSRLLSKEVTVKVKGIDEVLEEYRHSINLSPVLKGVIAANAIYELNQAIDDKMMKGLMFLAGTSLGFKTDKDSWGDGYSKDIIKKCCIQALLFGVEITGNQFNIIKSNVYITKEGFTYLLGNIKGLDYSIVPTIPEEENKVNRIGAVVNVLVKWKKGRGSHEEKLQFFCKGDKDKQGNILTQMDSYIAKAERKAKHWLYHRITGTMLGEAEAEEETVNKEETKGDAPTSIGSPIEATIIPRELSGTSIPEKEIPPVEFEEQEENPVMDVSGDGNNSIMSPEELALDVFKDEGDEGEKVAEALAKLRKLEEDPEQPKKMPLAERMREEAKQQMETK